MTQIVWDETGEHIFETAIDRGVLYPIDGIGVPWNGLISVGEAPSGSDSEIFYIDGQVIRSDKSSGSFAASIEAFTYPSYLDDDLNTVFNFAYRTLIGNDINGLDNGYKIHLVYNALINPSNKEYSSLNKEINPLHFNWDLTTTPFPIDGNKASAHLIIDSRKAYPETLILFEEFLYGNNIYPPKFPSFDELFQFFEDTAILKITDNGDGTWTAEGPDDVVYLTDATTFEIAWSSAVYIDTETYRVKSL